jgi:hypothetical protein
VSVVERRGEWDVIILENGLERSQSFLQRDWADNYARGQRLRLGLPSGNDLRAAAETAL